MSLPADLTPHTEWIHSYLEAVGRWHTGKPPAVSDKVVLTPQDLADPVTCWVRIANRMRYTPFLLVNAWVLGNEVELGVLQKENQGVREWRVPIPLSPDACTGLMQVVLRRGNERAPNTAESPIIAWTEYPQESGVTTPTRYTVERRAQTPKRVSVRFNYAISPEAIFPRDLLELALQNIVGKRPCPVVLCIGPSGAGKTTAMAVLLQEWARRERRAFTYVGRYVDPVLFISSTRLWGWGEDIEVVPTPNVAFHEQASFGGALGMLEAAVSQGPTRTMTDALVVDEVLTAEDYRLLMAGVTAGMGVFSTMHASPRPVQGVPPWVTRFLEIMPREIRSSPPDERYLPHVGIAISVNQWKVIGVAVEGEWHWSE